MVRDVAMSGDLPPAQRPGANGEAAGVRCVWFWTAAFGCFWCAFGNGAPMLQKRRRKLICVKRRIVPRPGFEPGSRAREARILDRARLPVGVAGAGYGPRDVAGATLTTGAFKNFSSLNTPPGAARIY
jgi:hypothetical protein